MTAMPMWLAIGAAAVLGLGVWLSSATADPPESNNQNQNPTPSPETAVIGKTAPAFTLEDTAGKSVSLSDFKGKIVIIEWFSPACPYTKRHARSGTMSSLLAAYKDKDVVLIAVNSEKDSSVAGNADAAKTLNVSYPILNDASGKVGKAYGAKTATHMAVIDANGNVAYLGAIDDDPRGNKESRVNYVKQAVDELLAGKSVSTPEVRSYG